jgi:hypothetical protein
MSLYIHKINISQLIQVLIYINYSPEYRSNQIFRPGQNFKMHSYVFLI